jgi:hypothetical protein
MKLWGLLLLLTFVVGCTEAPAVTSPPVDEVEETHTISEAVETPTTTPASTVPPNKNITEPDEIDPYLFIMRDAAREEANDLLLLINGDEMDRLHGDGFSDRFIETIESGTEIVNALEKYKEEKGKYPETLEDLTPDFMEEIPKTSIKHEDIRFSPYWTNDDDTQEYFQEYQKFWYSINDNLDSFGLVFSGPSEYCEAATWSLDERNKAQTYPFICYTQSILMRLEPLKFTEKFETDSYVFYVPPGWRDRTEEYSSVFNPFEAYFIGDGGEFPIGYNNGPLMMILWLFEENVPISDQVNDKLGRINDEDKLEIITEGYIEGYYTNPDRVFPDDFDVEQKKIRLSSGEAANFIHVRFYRKSKNLNQSRYDLMMVNPEDGQGYAMTLSVQYSGDYQKAEEDLRLTEFAEQLFSSFEFRD